MVWSAIYYLLFVLVVFKRWQITQHDFVIVFLNLPLDIEFYMELLLRINKLSQVTKLLKIFYGLKQSFQLWFKALAHLFTSLRFFLLFFEFSIFTGSYRRMYLIVAVYVDDLLIFSLKGSKTPAKLVNELGN